MARIAVVAGDGIGTEVIAQARKVLDAVLPGVETTEYDLGAARYHRTGEVLPDSVLDELAGHDAILLGAVGDPSRAARRARARPAAASLRFAFDQYVNLRPSRLWPGTTSPLAGVKPGEIDLVVVREGTEGLYAGRRRRPAPRHPGRDRHRGEPQHPARRRAGHPGRVRPRRRAASAARSPWCTRPTC